MRIAIRFFALLRDKAGVPETAIALPEHATVAQAADLVARQFPALAELIPKIAFAVNREYVQADRALDDGDELAFIPAVSGGSNGHSTDMPDLWLAFADGQVAETSHGPITLRCQKIADIVLPTGKVVACDAFDPEVMPFTVALPRGSHPVMLTIGQYKDGDQRVIFASIRVKDIPPQTWEMALLAGQQIAALESGQYFGYPVDSGTGCFMDERVALEIKQRLNDEPDYARYLMKQTQPNYVDTWDWADVRPDERDKANAVIFSSGVGDGMYASYFGRDAGGEVVCLVTDFNVIDVV